VRRPALTEEMVRRAVLDEFGGGVSYIRPIWRSGHLSSGEPVSKPQLIGPQLEVLCREAEAGCNFALLVPAKPDTRWFHDHCVPWEVRFLKGRVRLDGEKGAAPFPSAIVIAGPVAKRDIVQWWDIRGGVSCSRALA
jgi:hypothetical protein